jgi:hypothetical protein
LQYEESKNIDQAWFFVEGTSVVEAMRRHRDNLLTPNGRPLRWRSMTSPPPMADVDANMKAAIMKEMSDHYVIESKALDLSNFAQHKGKFFNFRCKK